MKKLIVALLVVMIGGTLGVGIAYAYTHTFSEPWSTSYQTCTYKMQDTFGSLSKTQFADACVHWNGQLTKNFLYKSSSDTAEVIPYENGNKTVTRRAFGVNGIVGECYRYLNSENKVKETDINLNTSYPFANSKLAGYYDVQSILTHELGHTLRVGHSTVSADTMYNPIPTNTDYARTVTTADRDAARASTARWFQ